MGMGDDDIVNIEILRAGVLRARVFLFIESGLLCTGLSPGCLSLGC